MQVLALHRGSWMVLRDVDEIQLVRTFLKRRLPLDGERAMSFRKRSLRN